MSANDDIVFGPVASRRLGASLGINNLPCKTCSYACVYCQAGPTCRLAIDRGPQRDPGATDAAVRRRLEGAARAGERIDFLTIVPTGEPTLDAGLGTLIDRLGWHAPPTAVVTNASLLWREDVRAELAGADWVSVKIDTAIEPTWRRLNRPHGRLSLELVLDGVRQFRSRFRGTFVTETMLVAGVNDTPEELEAVAQVLGGLAPTVSYLSAPIRPPLEPWVQVPGKGALAAAVAAVKRRVPVVRLLIDDEDDACGAGEDVEAALVATAAVHPLRTAAVEDLLRRARSGWPVVDRLVNEGRLERVTHRGRVFYRARRRPAAARAPREGRSAP
jgi:wyosine [tRNA(Phe)-imidazoG37] synthetase (radical SAM superfamily)